MIAVIEKSWDYLSTTLYNRLDLIDFVTNSLASLVKSLRKYPLNFLVSSVDSKAGKAEKMKAESRGWLPRQ